MNWIELKALNILATSGKVKLNETLAKSGEMNYLINSLGVLDKTHAEIIALHKFDEIYRNDYSERYEKCLAFLVKQRLLKPQIRFEENDMKILMNIQSWKEEGVLDDLRRQIIESNESLRGVSLMFFKTEKYLDGRTALISALKTILEVTNFSNEKDQQYIYKLECHDPKAIVLCENLDFLTKPSKPRQYHVELWYAGGKNVPKLEFANARGLPIYYLCDWDYDGLFIIYPLVKNNIPSIRLLTPDGPPRNIEETEHNSKWRNEPSFVDATLFDSSQQTLIKQLSENNQWIIEESNDLFSILHNQKIIFE